MTDHFNCDNCGKGLEMNDTVYFEKGLTYNACSLSCLAVLKIDFSSSTVEERIKYLT